ncbi:MAG: antitoxin VapB family protein [Candidatus Thermoplasmatota archaeon]|jgi:predicted CopG family antitoxin|nr:antitoxin VapB family protein [Candidatus Thermoplasmatota archaeon]MCL5988614.1 antitoxin VapB family protein [Candidatus Thermoplasmatota archaeon]
MGSKNISISDEAYSRLKKMKGKNESFTDLIIRLTNKVSLLDLRGMLTSEEAHQILEELKESRKLSRERFDPVSEED